MTNERLAVSSSDLDDVDLTALDAYLAQRAPGLWAAGGRDECGLRLGLLAKVAPRMVPTLVGLYAFGKVPQYTFPEWGVSCLVVAGTSLADPVEHRVDLEGPLPALLAQAMAFVASHGGGEGAPGDAREYPSEVVREVLVNALVHRDLRRPSRVAVRLFTDRLEVWSPGGPPEGLSDLEEAAREGGVSLPRNPLLAAIARHLGLGEQIGRGLLVVVQHGATRLEQRVELRTTPRDVLVVVPSRWERPRRGEALS